MTNKKTCTAGAELPIEKISVRNLVEFLLRSGDINTALPTGRDQEAMLAGGRIHRKIQKSEEKRTKGAYHSEVSLQYDTAFDELILRVEGRADGIIDTVDLMEGDPGKKKNGQKNERNRIRQSGQNKKEPENSGRKVLIDEIKGMYLDVMELKEPFPVHLAQAKCYAFIYADQQDLPEIGVRMTYANLDTGEIRHFEFSYLTEELGKWFRDLIREYHKWARWRLLHQKTRDRSMQNLSFPFPYRKGQKKLTAAVYHTIAEGKELFLMAPTGVGKTMSCIYPAVRAIGEGTGDRIFYLTAKNETLTSGTEAFQILRKHGLTFMTVQMTSKEKICPLHEVSCTPSDCPYAKGHFDRVNEVLYEFLTDQNTEVYDRDNILQKAEEAKVCPYELTRDLTEWSDAVLCDYNYVFDPNARLRNFFGEGAKSDTIFLIDEAHNLVDRGRDMYSASLCKEHVLAAKRALADTSKKQKNALSKVNSLLLDFRHSLSEEQTYRLTDLTELEPLLYACLHAYEAMQELFQTSRDGAVKEKLLDFYFELGNFCSVFQAADDSYQPYLELRTVREEEHGRKEKKEFCVNLFCVNPATRLTECIEKGRTAVFFSATLLPVSYFKELLTVKEDCYAVYAESPFLKENRKVLIGRDVSTRYKSRGYEMYRKIAYYISVTAKSKRGNYFAFFPSYQMMRQVFKIYKEEYDCPEVDYVMQGPVMSGTDREIFLENFYEDPERSLVAFAVMGGIFSEGIDLTGAKLIGAVVVGAGLPQVSPERTILKEYYDAQGRNGFDYAYVYPGMNKVEQAGGRVIRTATDRGVILLLDQRFFGQNYRALFPREWSDADTCTMDTVEEQLQEFWRQAQN